MEGSMTMTLALTLTDSPIPNAARPAKPSVVWAQNHSGCFCRRRVMSPYRDAISSPDTNATILCPTSTS